MNRQAFLDVMDNKETQGIPALFWFHFSPQAAVVSGPGNPELFETTLEGHKRYLQEVPYGAIKVMTEGYFLPSSLRNLTDYSSESLRNIKRMDADDPWIEEQVALCRKVVEATEGKSAVFFTVFSPLYYLIFRNVCGALQNKGLNAVFEHLGKVKFINNNVFKKIRLNKFMALGNSGILNTDPDAFIHAHDTLVQDLKTLTERLLREGGADGIFFSVQTVDSISETDYKKFVSSGEKEILDFAAEISDYNILHICGQNFKSFVDTYRDYNAKMYNWPSFGYGPSLKDGKAFFGGKAVIGGFSESKDGLLYNGTRKEIEDFTEELVKTTGRQGLVIGVDCAIQSDINRERLKWVRDKAITL
jgi:uroporphyrinogen decarboxylase